MRQAIFYALALGAAALALVLASNAAGDAEADATLGLWLTEDDQARVEITRTEDGYAGTIVWLKEPLYADDEPHPGEPKRDLNNPDPALRNRPIIGLRVLEGFSYNGKGMWTDGTIYDPENGRTYRCRITREGDSLHVRGFIGVSLIGRTTVWNRYTPKETDEKREEQRS